MSTSTIRWDKDDEGIVTLTLDDPNQRANTMNDDFRSSLSETVERLEAEKDSVTGVIVTSAKDTFFAGGDLNLLQQVTDENEDEFARGVARIKADFRRLEKLGKPTVAALNGAALGGGLEIALACNRRIALDNPKSQFGLPEVTLGLLPGAGGVTRIVRMLGLADGLMKVLLQGNRYKPAEARDLGLDRRGRRHAGGDAGQGARVDQGQPRDACSPGTTRATACPAARRPARSSPACCRPSPAT